MQKKLAIILGLALFLMILSGCCADDSGRIPITTSSCEARDSFLRGRELAENLQNADAMIHYEKAIELDPDFALAYFAAAMVQPSATNLFKYLDKAISLIDRVSEGEKLMILGMQAGLNGEFEQQLDYYYKLLKMYPEDINVLYQLGNIKFAQQQYKEAIKYYNEIIKIDENYAPVYNQLGYSFRNLEMYEAAEKSLKKYIQLIPNNPNPYDSYGELLLKMGEYEASIEQYEKALSQDSNFVASTIGIASNLTYISDYEEARLQLEKYYFRANSDEEKRRALIGKAVCYVDEGNFKSALTEINKLIEETKRNKDHAALANAYVIMGAIYFEREKYELAKEYFDKSLKTIEESNLPDEIKRNSGFNFLFGKSIYYATKKNFKKALTGADKFMAEANRTKNLNQIRNGHEIYGRIAFEMKDYEKAVSELKQSNLQNPYNLYRIAMAYKKMGDLENAKLYLKKTVNFNSFLDLNYAFCRIKAKNKLIDLQ